MCLGEEKGYENKVDQVIWSRSSEVLSYVLSELKTIGKAKAKLSWPQKLMCSCVLIIIRSWMSKPIIGIIA